MGNHQKDNSRRRLRKSRGVRRRTRGNTGRPRLSVFRSSKYIYAQVIDDSTGRTLASASQLEKDLRSECQSSSKTQSAAAVGKRLAERMKEKGVSQVVFDRGWYRYHGRVKALADAVREGGIKF